MRSIPAFVWFMITLVAFQLGWIMLGGVKNPDSGVDPLIGLFWWLIAIEAALAAIWLLVGLLNRYPDELGDGAVLWTLLGLFPLWTLRTEGSPGKEQIRRGVGRAAMQRALAVVADEVRPVGRNDWLLLSREKYQVESYHDMAVLQALIHDLKNSALEHGVVLDELEERIVAQRLTETCGDALPRLRHSADDIARRLVELSSLARLHKLYTEPVDPDELTVEALQRLDSLPGAGDITYKAQPGLSPVPLDRLLMRLALDNVIRNALQAACKNGGVTIFLQHSGAWLEWRISNPGELTAEALANIYKPGWTTRPGGAGLGAAVSRKIVRRHGGVLRHTSENGQVTAQIRLPYKD